MSGSRWNAWSMSGLALHHDGRPGDLPLVLLPAFPMDGRMWRGVRRALGSGVIAVDPPGFGDSKTGRRISTKFGGGPDPSLEAYARALADALDEIRVDRVVLAGSSMGGYTVLAFTELFPERVAGIGLIGTKSTADSTEVQEIRLAQAAAASEPQLGFFQSPKVGDAVSPTTRTDREAVFDTLRNWYEQVTSEAVAWGQRAMAFRPDRTEVLREFTGPVRLVYGMDDAIVPRSDALIMAEAAGQELIEVPRAGHHVAVEEPEIVAEVLADLVAAARS